MSIVLLCGLFIIFCGVFIGVTGILNDSPAMGFCGVMFFALGLYFTFTA